MADLMVLREQAARELEDRYNANRKPVSEASRFRLVLPRRYTEDQAAEILQEDVTSLKRWRRAGHLPYIAIGEKNVRYLGMHLCDIQLFGNDARGIWDGADIPSESSASETSTSPSLPAPPRGTSAGSTERLDTSGVSALAQRILKPPR